MSAITWRSALVQTHRLLGIGGGLLFVAWFASGIVMIYARMPEFDADERRARLPPLDASRVAVGPGDAASAADANPAAMRLGMLGARPVYRFGAAAVFAETGQPVPPLSPDGALEIVRAAWPEHGATSAHERRLTEPDQWTLQSRAYLPLHLVALGDPRGTRVYVAERTGEWSWRPLGRRRSGRTRARCSTGSTSRRSARNRRCGSRRSSGSPSPAACSRCPD